MLHLGATQGKVKTVFGKRLHMRVGSAEASQLLESRDGLQVLDSSNPTFNLYNKV